MSEISEVLARARRYEEERGAAIAPADRPALHLSTRVGWLNDPNGFSFYGGKWHLFYQYHPYDSHWGLMHWGHAVSADLLHWDYLPAAMAPDEEYDRDGVFSGSALTLPDGRQMLMYTGVRRETQEDGSTLGVQTQNIAFGDGLNYQKYEHNPVLTEADLPEGGSRYDFRDPKIWCEDGVYYMVAVNNQAGRGGCVLLFRSADALHWERVCTLAENRQRIGLMWECPDFFELDGYHVLLCSAMDMLPRGFEYHNGNGVFYFLGHYETESGLFREGADHAVDYGIDFYAPQTVLAPDGRRILIGWMQNVDTCGMFARFRPWFGQMTLPRELSVRNGLLYQWPIRELDALRGAPVTHRRVLLRDEEITLPEMSGRVADLELELEPVLEEGVYQKFTLFFHKDDQFHTGLSFRPQESTLKIDRKFSGSRRAIIHQRRAKVRHENGRLRLRVILDRFSVEIFVNGGEQVLSATLYSEHCADGISFYASGAVRFSVTKYALSERKEEKEEREKG